jgi:lipopolysaccharide/colanic/teichoic acid biosynthesis glycosyltransferase
MIKRLFDLIASSLALVLLSPLLIVISFFIFVQDFHNPLYISKRVGMNGKEFSFFKFRSMRIDADKSGVDSTSNEDPRITSIGKFIRKYKIDELSQLLNVFLGNMSLVGPRPNVKRDTDLYTSVEKDLFLAKPGITDFSSIVFADEGDILEGYPDPDLAYNQLIRPWKSRLGLIYIEKQSLSLDIRLITLTILSLISREKALDTMCKVLEDLNAPKDVISAASRKHDFEPHPPPGSQSVVMTRDSAIQ